MGHVTTRRRLVKSPPELWAEVSDPAALARHLGELGEIRITRTLPETTVAWEAERAAGIIEIEASGWGTRVSLSASPATPVAPEPPPPPSRVETELRVVAAESVRVEIPAPEPEPEPKPEIPPETEAAAAAEAEPAQRPGLLARLFGRRPEAPPPPEAPAAPEPPAPEPPAPPSPPEVLELRVHHAVCASRVPERPAAGGMEAPALQDVLERVLDDLGAAHHLPFSRG